MLGQDYIPQQGDMVWMDFDLPAGHEQQGQRLALVLSPASFNKTIGLALMAPITSRVRGHAFEVLFSDQELSGVILCQHIRMMDFGTRELRYAERVGQDVLKDVLAKVRAIIMVTAEERGEEQTCNSVVKS